MSKIKIGILTFHRAINYGAILQSYALVETLNNFNDVDAKIIDYTPKHIKKLYVNPKNIFAIPSLKRKLKKILQWMLLYRSMQNLSVRFSELEKFIENKLALTNKVGFEELPYLNERFDKFIVGSDQVWVMRFTDYDESYFLPFVTNDTKKISYAASLLTTNDQRTEELIRNYLPAFNAVSVREQTGVSYLKSKFDIDSCCVLDPTFLLCRKSWLKLTEEKYKSPQSKFIFIYVVGWQSRLLNYAFEYAKAHNLEVISLNHLKGRRGYRDLSDSSIEQFLGLINDAECVFTTSFHGLALSINLHTDFYFEVSENSHNNNDRLLDITQKLGLSDRNIVNGLSDNKIDWEAVESKLSILRKESLDFLKNAIGVENNEA